MGTKTVRNGRKSKSPTGSFGKPVGKTRNTGRPSNSASMEPSGNYSGFQHRFNVWLYASKRCPIDRGKGNPQRCDVLPMQVLGIPCLPWPDAALFWWRSWFLLGTGSPSEINRGFLQTGVFWWDHHRGTTETNRRIKFCHHRRWTAFWRGRCHAHRQGPFLPTRSNHKPSWDGMASTSFSGSPGSQCELPGRSLPDPYWRNFCPAASGVDHE